MAKFKRTKSMGNMIHKETTIDKIKFDSKVESEYYVLCKEQKKKGLIKDFELQPQFILQHKFFIYENELISFENEEKYNEFDKLRKKYNKANPDDKIEITAAIKYISDFKIIYNDGTTEIIDVKGEKTTDFKIKEKMFNYKFPHLKLTCMSWDYKTKQWFEYKELEQLKKERKKNSKTKKNK